MNRQTKAYRKLGLSTKVNKGANYASVIQFEVAKGRAVNSHFAGKGYEGKRKSRWQAQKSDRPPLSLAEQRAMIS